MADRNVNRIHGGHERNKAKEHARRLISEARGEVVTDQSDLAEEEAVSLDYHFDYCDQGSDSSDAPYVCLDDGWGYPDYPFEEPTFLIEDSWREGDGFDSMDSGIGYLRYIMEGVKPSKVCHQNIQWIAEKYTLLSAIVLGGLLSVEFFENEEESLILGRYSMALEDELGKAGIEFTIFNGLTERGWETYKRLVSAVPA